MSAPPTTAAGATFNFTVTAEDAFNNTATGYVGTVQFTSTDGQAVLPAPGTLANGVGFFAASLRTTGVQTIKAGDTVTSSITGISGPISVTAGVATHYAVTAPASVTSNVAFTFTVTAEDQFNNTATGYAGTAHITSSDAAATLPASSTLTAGVGTFNATLKTTGVQTLVATDTVTSTITGTANVTVDAPPASPTSW